MNAARACSDVKDVLILKRRRSNTDLWATTLANGARMESVATAASKAAAGARMRAETNHTACEVYSGQSEQDDEPVFITASLEQKVHT